MGLADVKDSYVRKKEIPFSSEQRWMAVKCSPKTAVSFLLCPFPPSPLHPEGSTIQVSRRKAERSQLLPRRVKYRTVRLMALRPLIIWRLLPRFWSETVVLKARFPDQRHPPGNRLKMQLLWMSIF